MYYKNTRIMIKCQIVAGLNTPCHHAASRIIDPPDSAMFRITVIGLVTLVLAMGVGRFAFTPMLPMMREDGLVDIEGGGILASVHFLGCWLGAVSVTRIPCAPKTLLRNSLITMTGLQEAHRIAPKEEVMRHIAVMTAVFATGQMLGPVFASSLYGLTESFSLTLVITSALLLVTAMTLTDRPATATV